MGNTGSLNANGKDKGAKRELNRSTLDRRTFIKNTAAAAAGIAAGPMILPRNVMGMGGKQGANDRLVLAVIGLGDPREGEGGEVGARGAALAKHFSHPMYNATVALKVDVHDDRGDIRDYREALDRKDIDAVVIAAPDHWHAPMAIHAAQAGKHIYTEKPLTYKISEGRKMVEATRRYNVVHQTGSQQRSIFDNYRGCMLVRNGVIGRIKKVIVYNYPSPMRNALPGGAPPDSLDWEMWCGPGPLVPYDENVFFSRANPGWISLEEFSSGELGTWGGHGIDQVQWALGMDHTGPVEIWTEGEPFEPWIVKEPRRGRLQGPNEPKVFMRYDDGGEGIVMEFNNKAPLPGAIFVGEKGTLTLDRGSFRTDPPELAVVRPHEFEAMEHQLYLSRNHLRDWIECIKTGKKPIADVEIGHRTATVCHLGNIARWTGRRLHWDPVKEEFRGDPEANQYLDYERRKGYELPA